MTPVEQAAAQVCRHCGRPIQEVYAGTFWKAPAPMPMRWVHIDTGFSECNFAEPGSPDALDRARRDGAVEALRAAADDLNAEGLSFKPGQHGDGGLDLRTTIALLPTPTAERAGRNQSASEGATIRWSLDYICELLPTPRATDGTKGGPNQRGSSGDLMLPSAVHLLPTPTATDSKASGSAGYATGHDGTTLTDATVRQPDQWGEYEPAIRRWEGVTRPAPEPTRLNAKGSPKLSDLFDEWLMGYPAGWITDVPGVTWNETLKACGNGVVPQQGAAALRWLRTMATWRAAA